MNPTTQLPHAEIYGNLIPKCLDSLLHASAKHEHVSAGVGESNVGVRLSELSKEVRIRVKTSKTDIDFFFSSGSLLSCLADSSNGIPHFGIVELAGNAHAGYRISWGRERIPEARLLVGKIVAADKYGVHTGSCRNVFAVLQTLYRFYHRDTQGHLIGDLLGPFEVGNPVLHLRIICEWTLSLHH